MYRGVRNLGRRFFWSPTMRCFILHAVLVVAGDCVRAQSVIPLVDIKSVDPTIVIELRYAGANILAGRALYPPGTPALVHPEVALPLVAARAILRRYKYRLKIWGGYCRRTLEVAACCITGVLTRAFGLHRHCWRTGLRVAGFEGRR